MHDEEQPTTEPANEATVHVVHALMQFLVAVRYRIKLVAVAVGVAILLGGLYYATATRYYGARASLLVMQTLADGSSPVAADSEQQPNHMATFETLVRSTKVLEGALAKLAQEDCVDLVGLPRERRVDVLRENCAVYSVRYTNILEVNYRSKEPQAAVNVVNAIVESYLEFMDETHKGTAGEVLRQLTDEKVELGRQLTEEEQRLTEARLRFGDIGARPDGKVVHPVVQRAMAFGEQLTEVQRRRQELQSTLATLDSAARDGRGTQQAVLALSNVVGHDALLQSLGFNGSDAAEEAKVQAAVLDDRAELARMRENLGAAHPEVVALTEKIRSKEAFLQGHQDRVAQKLSAIESPAFAPVLRHLVEQELAQNAQMEASLGQLYAQACNEAAWLNNQMSQLEIMENHVEWLRNAHLVLLDKIARTDFKQEGQEIRTAVLHEPTINESPISPNLRHVLLLALAGGMCVGLASVYVLDILDDRFRSVEEMQAHLGLPMLAMVQRLPPSEAAGALALQMVVAPSAVESEAFRTLRTALSLHEPELRQLVVTSAEPGDGKTTVLANLAVCYAQSNKKTLVIDADLRRPGLTAMLAFRGQNGVSDIIRSSDDLGEMAARFIQPTGVENLDALPSGPRPANPAELLNSQRFSQLLSWAESVYDQVFIDTPPVLATSDSAVVGRLVDGMVLVIQPEKNRRRMVTRVVRSLSALKLPLTGVVINRVGSEKEGGYYAYTDGYTYQYDYHSDDGDDAPAVLPMTQPCHDEGSPLKHVA